MPVRQPRRPGRPRTPETNLVPVPLKLKPEVRRQFKVAAAEEGMTYSQLLAHLLEMRASRSTAQKATMASPLHRPKQPRLADLEMPGR